MIRSKHIQWCLILGLSVCVMAQAVAIYSLRRATAPQPTHRFFDLGQIDFDHQITFGDPQAPQKVILYTAPYCSPCGDLLERALTIPWHEQNQVQLIVKYAISDPDQVLPSSAVIAAYEQKAHREMIEFLQEKPAASQQEIVAFIDELNLDAEHFEKALASRSTKEHLAQNRAEGAFLELEHVPFVIIDQRGYDALSPNLFEEKINELVQVPIPDEPNL